MDFTFTPEQDEAAALAASILADRATPERLTQVEDDGDRFDRELWRELGAAGLLSLHLPEADGGAGLGLTELARVLVEVGRHVAPLPLAAHGPAGLLVAEVGTAGQRAQLLPDAADGSRLLTVALAEPLEQLPDRPSVTATAADDGWVLNGTKTIVRAGMAADTFLVTATTTGGAAVFVVDAAAPGLQRSAQTTSDGDVVALVELADVRLEAGAQLGANDGVAARRLGQLATIAAAAEQLGVVEGAVRLTAEYAKAREQFGRPIGTFQAVSQRLADGYIDSLFQALTLWQAVWRLEERLDAEVAVASAKLWAADAGHHVAHTAVHVHGGVGIDLDGEAHRYFTAAKRFEFSFGAATEQALAIGKALARS